MERLWIVPLLCGLVILGCVLPYQAVTHYCDHANAELDRCAQLARTQNWEPIRERTDSLLKEFDTFRQRAGCCLPDDLLNPVRDALYELAAWGDAQDTPMFLAACNRVRPALESLWESQELSLSGIL